VLRGWIAGLGLPPLPGNGITCIEADLLHAAADTEARFDWAGTRMQRWRDHLYAFEFPVPLPTDWSQRWDGRDAMRLPNGGSLVLTGVDCFDAPMRVHARQGGERIILPARAHHHTLKHVLQDKGVPPWQRLAMPLLSDAAGELHAAGGGILSAWLAAWLQDRGAQLNWDPGPAP
jgi:tRNA(Ile)-lysidine synthase